MRFSMNENRKLSDIPTAMTLPVNRHVDVHVTGNELIGVDSDEPLLVLRMRGTGDNHDDDDQVDDCAVEFEVVEPFQPKSAIQAFASLLGASGAVSSPVWLLVDMSLLKSDRLNVPRNHYVQLEYVWNHCLCLILTARLVERNSSPCLELPQSADNYALREAGERNTLVHLEQAL